MTFRDGKNQKEPGVSKEEIEAIAADWAVRIDDGELTAQERKSLDGWLAEDAAHRAAFEFAVSTWRDLGALLAEPSGASVKEEPVLPALATAPAKRRTYGSTDLRRRRTTFGNPGRRSVRAAAIAAVLLLAVGFAGIWDGDPVTILTADIRTGPDETRPLTLEDGSTILLGPSSALALRFDSNRRGFNLLSGVVFVTAAPTASDAERRPFRVDAGSGSATALGTQYVVERLEEVVRVTVVEHEVEVALSKGPDLVETVVLHPGDSVRYGGAADMEPVTQVSLLRAMGWRDGRLVFDRVPLAEVVAVLNRYRRGRIVIADEVLAARTVSGSFNAADLDSALHAITRELGARTAAVPPFVTVLF